VGGCFDDRDDIGLGGSREGGEGIATLKELDKAEIGTRGSRFKGD